MFLISLLANLNRSFMLLCEDNKIVSLANIIRLSIFVAYCRSFTKIRKRRGPSIDPCGTLHTASVIVSNEVFSLPYERNCFEIV